MHRSLLILLASAGVFASGLAGAAGHHPRRHALHAPHAWRGPEAYRVPAATPHAPIANWSTWEFDTIERATARAQLEPGVTKELAPDSEQTATGGPSGGVPGFSGGM